MTTKELRNQVSKLQTLAVKLVGELPNPKQEIAVANCPSLSWNDETLETTELRPLKIAHNNLARLLGKLSPGVEL